MKYFATKNADINETKTINDQVSFYKDDTLIRSKYMTYEFDIYQSRQEGRAEGKAEEKLEIVDAMLAKTKLTDQEISSVSGIPQDEIAKRRTQHQK
jgi:predicted transposase/invertase (TIGR01784 family)